MSLYGEWKTITLVQATDDDLTPACDLGNSWEYMQLVIPAITASTIGLLVARKSAETYQTLGDSSNVIASSSGGFSTTLQLGGFQFIKIKTSAGQAADRTFYARGYRM